MLTDHTAIPVLAVADLDKARTFYEQTLGLPAPQVGPDGVVYRTASGGFLVYPSAYAGTNKATGISFQVATDAFDAEVDALRSAGVTLLTFDAPEGTWQDGVLVDGDARAAWFTDPDGNILNVETGMSLE
jgi:catechol 2,3-dioxygenase-like lactoylglutathione lyase family enzyme